MRSRSCRPAIARRVGGCLSSLNRCWSIELHVSAVYGRSLEVGGSCLGTHVRGKRRFLVGAGKQGRVECKTEHEEPDEEQGTEIGEHRASFVHGRLR